MNIRDHVRNAIRNGLGAFFDVMAEEGGVEFDDWEFVPFYNLGYTRELGYYKLGEHPLVESECGNDNPETVHLLAESSQGDQPLLYVWRDRNGELHMLGELHQVADLHNAIGELLYNYRTTGEPISEHDPAWNRNLNMPRAIDEALACGMEGNRQSIAAAIRIAAHAGALEGAKLVHGRWNIPPFALRNWVARRSNLKAGKD